MMSNKIRTVLYIGVTSNLANRVFEHKNGNGSVFTSRYKCFDLVYYEGFNDIEDAIAREKILKKWKREWKDNLIKKMNSNLKDLTNDISEFN